jgi:hypothetical protein
MPSNTLLVVRNGIFSNPGNMLNLENYLQREFANSELAGDPGYQWQKPVLHSGIELAERILVRMTANPPIDKIVFAGHSQGGLVCRVAVAALCAHNRLLTAIRSRMAMDSTYFQPAWQALASFPGKYPNEQRAARKAVHSIVMLGTPNAGAFTNGQVALLGSIFIRAAKAVAGLGGLKNFDELTTEKLFRVLQNLRIPHVRYVSISGSFFNRYTAMGWTNIASLPVISRLAPSLSTPNDTVVEDSSVDLRQAPLPTEIADIETQYTHVRSYTECLLTSHVSIHSDPTVFEALDNVPGWK